jgi:3-isopropylmalate dehydratase small subunit
MATEMGAIILFFTPDERTLAFCRTAAGRAVAGVVADPDAEYADRVTIDVEGLGPMLARPGHPEDAVPAREVVGRKIDSVFIGSCTNGRLEDLRAAARVMAGRRTAPGVVLKVVPATRRVWEQALQEGLLAQFASAGALVGNPGCAGCAAGQIGQNGPGEVTISTGNRNFAGKQGKGEVYLGSPETAAASAIAGVIAVVGEIPAPVGFAIDAARAGSAAGGAGTSTKGAAGGAGSAATSGIGGASAGAAGTPRAAAGGKPTTLRGRVWIVDRDNVDTDMIYHNRHLAVTDPALMGQHAFGNLPGWEDFARKVRPGDIVVTGKNFGCGSSRQQAVDCFQTLGVAALIAESFGAIYERNAINAGLPLVVADLRGRGLKDGDEITVDLKTSRITWAGGEAHGEPFSSVQMSIYQRGGLLVK